MAQRRVQVDPVNTLHKRLVSNRRAFVRVLDFVFHGLGWSNPWHWDCEVYFDIPRERFGFASGARPGDVDMLVVPCVGAERQWENATAIEVKTYGLNRARRDKSVGDTGREQVTGLARMGFPYVGLLHIVPVEAGAGTELAYLPLWKTETPYPPGAQPDRFVLADLSAMHFFFRQSGRMERMDLPVCAGVKIFALTLNNERKIVGTSEGHERAPTRNPDTSPDLIGRLPPAVEGREGVRVGYPRPKFRSRDL